MDDRLKVAVAGGKTGGHLFPALALVREIETRVQHTHVLFFGTRSGIEAKIVPQQGYDIEFLSVSGFQRKLSMTNLMLPFKLIGSIAKCFYKLKRFNPDIVIGTGGYVSAPVLLTAALLRYPTLIQEQNSYPGVTTRLLSRVVDQVHLSFEDSAVYFKNRDKLYVSGNPVRSVHVKVDRKTALEKFGLAGDRKTLFIFGGSQGAHSINLAVMHQLDELMLNTDWQLLWGTGESDFQQVQNRCEPYGARIKAISFITDMASAYSVADLVVSRAGATTLSELQACGLPAILVPYPYAAEGHQEANARALVAKNAARMVLDSDLTTGPLVQEINKLADDDDARAALGSNLKALAKPDAARDIIDKMMLLLK